MATSRFGSARPMQSYNTMMKWILAGVVSVLVILSVALIYVVQNSASNAPGPVVTTENTVATNTGSSVEILMTSQRIEEKVQIVDSMFVPRPWDSSQLPENVYLASEVEFLRGKYSKEAIPAHVPLLKDYVTSEKPTQAIPIPPGFRAITLDVDGRIIVPGFATNARVDVLWAYQAPNGKKEVRTIVRFTKVLVVGAPGPRVSVTVLVSEEDSKKIELARTLGTLTLSLVSDQEPPKLDPTKDGVGDSVDIGDLIGQQTVEGKKPADGVMYTTDPKTGKQIKYELRGGRWQPAEE